MNSARKPNKTLPLLLACLLCLASVLTSCAVSESGTEEDGAERYAELVGGIYGADRFMPALEDLPAHTALGYHYRETPSVVSTSFAITLFITFGDNYEEAKAALTDRGDYLEDPKKDPRGFWLLPVTEFLYKGYTLAVIPVGDIPLFKIGLLGFDDEKRTIVYAYFYDNELDYMAEGDEDPKAVMTHFMDEYFLWEEE